MNRPIRVLVVDDSALMRKMVTDMLAQDSGIEVLGYARDGVDALSKLEALQPDVITLDVEMPVMDGLTALAEIMRRRPTPVVMLSSLTQQGAETTLRCLELGAVDFVGKPGGSISLNISIVSADLIAKVKVAAHARVRHSSISSTLSQPRLVEAVSHDHVSTNYSHLPRRHSNNRVLVIGSSTGGPRALQTLVPALPADIAIPIVIVQHMPPGFTTSLAKRLNDMSPLCVREASAGDRLEPGKVLIAPGGHHLQFDPIGIANLSDEPPVHGVRPSVDVTLESLTKSYGSGVTAVLLTGMGRDGARGLKVLHDMGAMTFAEDESTCVVYGMPRAAEELGGVDKLLPLQELASAIVQFLR